MGMVNARDAAEVARGTLMLPLILLAVQFPLWILKMATGWQIVLAGTPDPASPAQLRQFRLQHILGATTVVAASFGLAGVGLPHLEGPRANADTSLWLGLMLACLIFCVFSALSTLPCLWAAFVARNKAAGGAAIAIYAMLMSVLAATVISLMGVPSPHGQAIRIFLPLFGGLAFVLLGCLHAARWCGYVLLRPRRMGPPATPTGSSPFAGSSDVMPPSV
jgi:hypothetical protein